MAARSDSKKDKNLALAVLGIVRLYKQFPLGGLNREDAIMSMEHVMYFSQLQLFSKFRRALQMQRQDIVDTILLSGKLKAAYCGEMAYFCSELIKEVVAIFNENILVEIVALNNHAMVVIGRDPDSNPNDIATWGENSVICDPWARKFYETSKFRLEQRVGEKIKIIKAINPSSGDILSTQDDYLEGSPRILKKPRF